jgi:His-Xaa-Ser system protein HxsD
LPETVVEFDRAIQSIGALREAAYRVIGLASCTIETAGERYVCHLMAKEGQASHDLGEQALRQHFIDLVTDENLREKVSIETAGLRDVILALAFGALAERNGGIPGS